MPKIEPIKATQLAAEHKSAEALLKTLRAHETESPFILTAAGAASTLAECLKNAAQDAAEREKTPAAKPAPAPAAN